MAQRLMDLVAARATDGLVGRDAELEALSVLADGETPVICHVHGIAGIGKSRLLTAFAAYARSAGAAVIQLDCRAIEPTPGAFLSEVANAAGAVSAELVEVTRRLAEIDGRVIVALDTYELFRLLDTWLRQEFVPALPTNARLVLAGRERPVRGWLTAPGWAEASTVIELRALREADALELLARLGIPPVAARAINVVARGHALALTVAAALAKADPTRVPKDIAVSTLVEELAATYLDTAPDDLTRKALLASSVARRVTEPLLRALLPSVAPRDAYERLAVLPFVEQTSDGLVIHDAIRDALERHLRLSDPVQHRGLRRAAWKESRRQIREGGRANLWRETADLLYLLENEAVRAGFFPLGTHTIPVEPALSSDDAAILAIVRHHDGPEAADAIAAWLHERRECFFVARNREGTLLGFSIFAPATALTNAILHRDPVARAISDQLATLESPDLAFIYRRILDAEVGEVPGEVSAAFSLDGKRTYMEVRPNIRYVCFALRDYGPYQAVMGPLGFRLMGGPRPVLDGMPYQSVVLDMGPGSVDQWLSAVVGRELGLSDDAPPLLDTNSRTLNTPAGPVHLTPLEFGVMQQLYSRRGKAVTRAALTESVWGYDADATSNVVEVVIRGLRKKLGVWSDLIETVRGVGYLLRE